MKVQIDFEDEELQPAIQKHLDGGPAIRTYIRAAVKFFNECHLAERNGFTVGHSKSTKPHDWERYNQEVSPGSTLLRIQP